MIKGPKGHLNAASRTWITACAVAGLSQCFSISSATAGISWNFDPPRAGHALYEGGWAMEYALGGVATSPEFSFPLQLVYLNSRAQSGLFGTGWFCPQLESFVIPREQGTLLWAMPSGGVAAFRPGKQGRELRSSNGEWKATASAAKAIIWNEEGWQFLYMRGKIVSITSPTGRVLEFVRAGDRLNYVQLRDSASSASQVVLALNYAEGGRRVTWLDVAGGQRSRFAYAKAGALDRLIAWQPQLGWPVQFRYDSKIGFLAGSGINRGGVWEITDYQAQYAPPKDSNDETPLRRRDPAAYQLMADKEYTYAYPELYSIVLTPKGGGASVAGHYDPTRGMLSTEGSEETKRQTIYYRAPGKSYDGKLRRVEENGRVLTEYRYDRKTGLLKEIIDENGLITFFDYPAGPRTRWEPKPVRVRRGTRAASEVIAEYSYDAAGHLLAAKDAAGNVTRFTYTPRGEVASVADSGGGRSSFAYDSLGRVVGVDRNGLVEKVSYDKLGRVAMRVAPDGSKTTFTYDANGQLTGAQRDGQPQLNCRRDALGRVVEETDPLGRSKKYDYDPRGNLLAEHAANGSVTRYEYDAKNRRIAQIDGNGNRIRFDYDPAGRLIRQTNALGKTLTWSYDPAGKLIARTNGVQTIAYAYDDRKRLAHVDYNADPGSAAQAAAAAPGYFGAAAPPADAAQPASTGPQTIDYTCDPEGRMLTAATPDASFEYVRNKRGQVEAMRCVEGGKEQLVRYRYDAAGRRTGLILAELKAAVAPSGGRIGHDAEYEVIQQTETTYDAAGRLSSIVDNGDVAVSYRYDAAGRLVGKAFGNGMKTAITYDAAGRLATMEFSGGPLSEPKALVYTWDAASQVTKRSWNGETQRYEYDPSGQLLKVINDATGEALEAYAYDKAGNMLEKTVAGEKTAMSYNAANELATRTPSTGGSPQPPVACTYDQAGRMLGFQEGARNRYGWLDKVTDLELPNGQKVAYTYWPDGQLAAKKLEKQNTEGIQKISYQSATSADEETFLWDGLALLRRNDTVYLIEPHPSGGVPIASHAAGSSASLTWYLNDLLGTTLATVQDGSTEYVKLTTYGQPLEAAPSAASLANPNSTSEPKAPAEPPESIQSVRTN